MLWMLDKWGHAWTAAPDAGAEGGYRLSPQPVAYVGPGRPLGFHWHQGRLLICDTKGLLALERSGGGDGSGGGGGGSGSPWALRVLANEAGGRPIAYGERLPAGLAGLLRV